MPSTAVLTRLLAFGCLGFCILRSSLVYLLVPDTVNQLFFLAANVAMLSAVVYVTLGGLGVINLWGGLLVLATGLSLWTSEQTWSALPRWFGWLAMVWAIGPMNSTAIGRRLRSEMFRITKIAFAIVTAVSALWWVARLPNLGRGDFTGVMWHSMLLGPVAAITALVMLARGLELGSPWAFAMSGVSTMVVMLASSRAALAALAVGILILIVLKLNRYPLASMFLLAMAFLIAVFPAQMFGLIASVLPNDFTAGLANKNWNNSREMHWQARWDEFLSSPFTGVGFATAWEDTIGVDDETGAVETGSSYLAMLSMTGCIGGGAFLLMAGSFAQRLVAARRRLTERQRLEACGLAGFWAVHLGAEGYIFAVGSLLALTFWLWLGCLNDDLCAASRPRLRPGNTSAPPKARSLARVALAAPPAARRRMLP
jgi:O-antigen ligase